MGDHMGFLGGVRGKEPANVRNSGSVHELGRSPGGAHGNPSVFFLGESNRQSSLVDYSP